MTKEDQLERENAHLREQVKRLTVALREALSDAYRAETGQSKTSWVERDFRKLERGEFHIPAHIKTTRWRHGN